MAGRKLHVTQSAVKRSQLESPTTSKKFTLADAFSPFLEAPPVPGVHIESSERAGHWEIERNLRAIALLLDSACEHGNAPVEGLEAQGLMVSIVRCADQVAKLETMRIRDDAQARLVSDEKPAPSAA